LSENDLCDFVSYATEARGLKQATVNSYLSSLAFFHKLRKWDTAPFNSFLVKQMLKGAKNLEFYKNMTKEARKAMTFPLLKILSHEISLTIWSEIRKQVIWTAMTVAFFGSFRLGEILAPSQTRFVKEETLLWRDVNLSEEVVTITIKIPKSKDPRGEYIDLFSLPDKRYCPVLALKKLKNMRVKTDDISPVFSFSDSSHLTPHMLTDTVRSLLTPHLGDDANQYSGHSFRAGLPSALAACPEASSEEAIKSWGRWSSESFRLYTRLKLSQRKFVFSKMLTAINLS
jgi:hypothetical protein